MKKRASFVALVTLFCLVVAPIFAATAPEAAKSDKSPVAPLATAVTTVTGIAISPLLGTGAYGAYEYFSAKTPEAKAALPWFAQVSFWLPALLIVGACAAKDSLGAVLPPGWKKPLDVLETLENKVSGLVAAGAVVPLTMASLSKMLVGTKVAAAGVTLVPTGLAMIQVGTIDGSWFLNVLTVPFGVAMFAIVWMASHAINALILLSPWGAIDAALKGARTALLGAVVVTAQINPWLGAALSLVVIVIAYFVAGWAFRLTLFSSIFCWDFFTLRRARFRPAVEGNKMFSAGGLKGVPARTHGRLARTAEGGLEFQFRPWMVLPQKVVPVPAAATIAVGRGFFFSMLDGASATLFFLPPRYRGHEEELASAMGFNGVREAGLRKAWGWIRESMGFGRKAPMAA